MEEIIQDLMKNPANLNPNVVRSQLKESISYKNLPDKPFTVNKQKIYTPIPGGASFEINSDGMNLIYKKVDNFMTVDEFIGLIIRMEQDGHIQEVILSEEMFNITEKNGVTMISGFMGMIFSVDSPISSEMFDYPINIPEAGTYVTDMGGIYQLIKPTSYSISDDYLEFFGGINRLNYYIKIDDQKSTFSGRQVYFCKIRENEKEKTEFTSEEKNNLFEHYQFGNLTFRYYDVEHGQAWKPIERYIDPEHDYYTFLRNGEECVVVI